MPPSKEWDAHNPTLSPGVSEDLKRFGLDVLDGEQGHTTNLLAQFRWMKRIQAQVDALEAKQAPATLPPVEPRLTRRVRVGDEKEGG